MNKREILEFRKEVKEFEKAFKEHIIKHKKSNIRQFIK